MFVGVRDFASNSFIEIRILTFGSIITHIHDYMRAAHKYTNTQTSARTHAIRISITTGDTNRMNVNDGTTQNEKYFTIHRHIHESSELQDRERV